MDELLLVDSTGVQWLAHHYSVGVAGLGTEVLRAALAMDRTVFRRRMRSSVTRIATPLGYDSGGINGARQLLLEFNGRVRTDGISRFQSLPRQNDRPFDHELTLEIF